MMLLMHILKVYRGIILSTCLLLFHPPTFSYFMHCLCNVSYAVTTDGQTAGPPGE